VNLEKFLAEVRGCCKSFKIYRLFYSGEISVSRMPRTIGQVSHDSQKYVFSWVIVLSVPRCGLLPPSLPSLANGYSCCQLEKPRLEKHTPLLQTYKERIKNINKQLGNQSRRFNYCCFVSIILLLIFFSPFYSVYVENEKARRSRKTSQLNMIRGAAVIRDR
jgi:hypothetical protein